MIILMKCLDEEKIARRCVSDFHDEPWVTRVVVIDGGSNDFTVHELKQFPKVEVYTHRWLDWYHDMEITQSNIALSYVPHGQICMILDFDERMSHSLKVFLQEVEAKGIPNGADVCHLSRRTVDLLRHEDSTHAMLDSEGWPIVSHQIGQYPDYQCRVIKRSVLMRWINSPHHQLIGYEQNVNVDFDIIHYEKEDYRDRKRIERKWALAQARRRELGLTADVFEARLRPEYAEAGNPNFWVSNHKQTS